MAAPTSYPSYAYNSTQLLTFLVTSAAQFNALPAPGTWTTTPYSSASTTADPNETITDTYLKNMLIEMRINNYLTGTGFNISDDVQTVIRPDVAANDVALTSL